MYKWARNAAISAAIAVLAACGGGGTDLAVNEPPPSESPPAEPPLAASALDPGAKFAPAQLYAIGVVTPNANDTLLEYQRVLGVLSCLNTPSGTGL